MVERGVRFVQIYHNNWDTHANVAGRLPDQCRDVDQACYGLIQDLKQRGLLDETLVIWGGEFGRTIYSQGGLSKRELRPRPSPRCFTMWMAGGGVKGGTIYGETDDFSYNIVKDPVHIRDFHATVLHLLGFDHERFTSSTRGSTSADRRHGDNQVASFQAGPIRRTAGNHSRNANPRFRIGRGDSQRPTSASRCGTNPQVVLVCSSLLDAVGPIPVAVSGRETNLCHRVRGRHELQSGHEQEQGNGAEESDPA
jgi:hypothetical protein